MAKLVYSSATWALSSNATSGALKNYAVNTDPLYKSLIFTSDGYLVTHGKVFKMVDTTSLTPSVTISIASGLITIKDEYNGSISQEQLPVWSLLQGAYMDILNTNNGLWTISHDVPNTENIEDITTLSTVITSDYTITSYIDKLIIDKFGHVQDSSTKNSVIHLDYVSQTITTDKYYLLGGASNEASTSGTVKTPDVYVEKDLEKGWQLVTPSLLIKGTASRSGISNIVLGNTSGGSTTLEDYIEKLVDIAKTQALVYQGTLDASDSTLDNPITNIKDKVGATTSKVGNGDTIKISKAGYIQLGTEDAPNVQAVKPGDVIIARVEQTNGLIITTWEYIPSGDELETSISVNGGAALFGMFSFKNNSNADYKAFDFNTSTNEFIFTNTTYKPFVGYGVDGKSPSEGLVPTPTASGLFLASDGTWAKVIIGEGVHTIAIGDSETSQNLTNTFSANSSTNVTTYIPLANEQISDSLTSTTWGAIKGNTSANPTALGWQEAQVLNGIVKYYNHTWSTTPTYNGGLKIADLTYDGNNTSIYVRYADAATEDEQHNAVYVRGAVGTASTVRDLTAHTYKPAPIVDGLIYYTDTFRPINCWGIANDNYAYGNIGDTDLTFSQDFIVDDAVYLTWAEVSEDGTEITYTH